MKIFNYKTVPAKTADCCAENTKVRWLITKEIGAQNFAMRLFEMTAGGSSPLHKHPYEHEIFVLEGEGSLFDGEKAASFGAGDVIFVPANEMHQFKNRGEKPLRFLCLIPYTKE